MTFRGLLSGVLALIGVPFLIYLKYLKIRHAEDRTEHKGGIETLFGGKK